jgi:predicted CoA-binding protein
MHNPDPAASIADILDHCRTVAQEARAAGLQVVQDKCLMVEHRRKR